MDDCLKAVHSVEEATRLVQQLSKLLDRGGFRLGQWLTNHDTVLKSVSGPRSVQSNTSLVLTDKTIHYVLGITWDVKSDRFALGVAVKEKPVKEKPCSRRGILSMLSALFDPLGFVAPVSLLAKIILQNLCRKGIGWDESIPEADRSLVKMGIRPTCSVQIKNTALYHSMY